MSDGNSLSWAARVAKLESIEISHSRYAKGRTRIKNCIELSKAREDPFCAVLVGPSGSGKSTLCNSFIGVERTERIPGRVLRIRDAMYIQVPSPTSTSALVGTLLEALGDPFPYRGHVRTRAPRLISLLRTAKTAVIFFDEFHHLTPADDIEKAVLFNWLKTLIDSKLKTCFVASGTDETKALVDLDPQISRRFNTRIDLGAIPIVDGSVNSFATFIRDYADRAKAVLGLTEFPDFSTADNILRVYALTRGVPGIVANLFTLAATDALSVDNGTVITLKSFSEVSSDQFFDNYRLLIMNPFEMSAADLSPRIQSALS